MYFANKSIFSDYDLAHMSSSVQGIGSNNIGELNRILSAIKKLNEYNFINDVEI